MLEVLGRERGHGAEGKRIVLVVAECKGLGIGRIRLLCADQVNSQCLSNAVSQLIICGTPPKKLEKGRLILQLSNTKTISISMYQQ